MAKIKQKISINDKDSSRIRKVWDNQTMEWYYSVADIMAVLTESVDARNYWKALKNRLKTSQEQLVTNCNQLKMAASDGKYYMVDAANATTILQIVQLIAPYNVTPLQAWFEHIELSDNPTLIRETPKLDLNLKDTEPRIILDEKKISTALNIPIDIFETKDKIVIKMILPGCKPDDITLAINVNNITINGKIASPQNLVNGEYAYQELSWGQFYRKINLPNLADVDNVSATEFHGLITVTVSKIDKEKNRFLKIKSI